MHSLVPCIYLHICYRGGNFSNFGGGNRGFGSNRSYGGQGGYDQSYQNPRWIEPERSNRDYGNSDSRKWEPEVEDWTKLLPRDERIERYLFIESLRYTL